MSNEDAQETIAEVTGVGAGSRGTGNIAVVLVIFTLGILTGIPVALFGLDFFVENALVIFGLLFGLLIISSILAGLVVAFRRPILKSVVRRSEVEMERFARPMSQVAKYAAEQKVDEAMEAAREVGELMLARYAWVSTRRWLIATITAFVAAIAALSGSALLFQQNQLLRAQGVLMSDQTDRLTDQTRMLEQQIELGEAQRSTSIVPEILEIGSLIGQETNALMEDGRENPIFFDEELSNALRGRIIAATSAARPYRYLNSALARSSESELSALALARRDDLVSLQQNVQDSRDADLAIGGVARDGELVDRPLSPERGQLLSILFNSRVMTTEWLTLNGADFSFAEVRMQTFGVISLKHALLRFADFSGVRVHSGVFGAAYLEQARFRRSVVADTDFSGILNADIQPPQQGDPSIDVWFTQMAGVDFRGAIITDSQFRYANAIAANFDYALVTGSDFSNASLAGGTFRNALIGDNIFVGADLRSVDFDGAYVFDADFLGQLEINAVPESFKRERFTLEPVELVELEKHPNAFQLWNIAAFNADAPEVWRIKRVQDFE